MGVFTTASDSINKKLRSGRQLWYEFVMQMFLGGGFTEIIAIYELEVCKITGATFAFHLIAFSTWKSDEYSLLISKGTSVVDEADNEAV